jgi:predicted DNA-binding protein with PD1-like motif
MKYFDDQHGTVLLRLDLGEKLVATLEQWFSEKGLAGAWVQVIGGVQSVEIGYYDLPNKQYQWHVLDQVMEITQASGSVSWKEGVATAHLHICLSDGKMNAYGGHLKEAVVGGTCELLIRPFDGNRLTRVHDEASGLYLLDTE